MAKVLFGKRIHYMTQSHIEVQSHSEPAARKLGVAGPFSVCHVNNDRILHWQRFNMRSALLQLQAAKWTADPGSYLTHDWR